jgi:hypothetical protein
MRKISVGLLALLIVALSVLPARAQFYPASQLNPDPCKSGVSQIQQVAISISSATTTQLVSPSNGKGIYVCGLYLESVGGTSTFEYGTGSACTGTNAITGALPVAAAATPAQSLFTGNTLFYAPSAATGNGLCLVSGASTSATAGWMLFVQQ